MRRAAAGEPAPLWILADRQTAGRGRSGRQWTSEAGNFCASLLIDSNAHQRAAGQLSLLAGVAVVRAIAESAGGVGLAGLRLKWPNDILIGVAKAGGILIESTTFGARRIAVIGIGLNLASAPNGLLRPVTCLAAHGVLATPRDLLARLDSHIDRLMTIWQEEGGFEQIRSAWLAHATAPGESLRVNAGSRTLSGTFQGIDADGALLMRDAHGHEHRFTFGEVMLGD